MWLARPRGSPGHLFPSFRRLLQLASLRRFPPSAGPRREQEPSLPPAEPTHFMVEYLRSSCGFSDAEARRASKHYAHLKSPEKPDAMLRLLRQWGLGGADIKRIVQKLPKLLLADAERTTGPKIRGLRGAGFSGPQVAQLISMNPAILTYRDVVPRVEFWRKLVGTNLDILKVVKRDSRVLCHNLYNRIIPGLSLLRNLGVPEDKMGTLARMRPRLVSGNPGRTRTLAEQVKSLGIPPGTAVFVQALYTVHSVSRSARDAKSRLLSGFGWTQAELASAIRRFPSILNYSQEKLRAAMDFLLNEAGCELSYIACHPQLVGYSMEKRLKPRFHVLRSLKAEGLPAGRNDFFSAIIINEGIFLQKYITPHSGRLPKLLETYHAARAKNCRSKIVDSR